MFGFSYRILDDQDDEVDDGRQPRVLYNISFASQPRLYNLTWLPLRFASSSIPMMDANEIVILSSDCVK